MEDAYPIRLLLAQQDGADCQRVLGLLSQIQSSRYDITWAATCEAAVEKMGSVAPHVCLLDEELYYNADLAASGELMQVAANTALVVLTHPGRIHSCRGAAAGAVQHVPLAGLTSELLERAIRYSLAIRTRDAALAAEQERIRLIEDQIPGVLWATDRDLRLTWAAGPGLRWLNLTPDSLVGKPLQEAFYRAEPPPTIISALEGALRGESSSLESPGSGRYWETHVRPLLAEDGAIAGTIGLGIDITERREAQRALRESEERYRTLIHYSTEVVSILAADGMIRYESPAIQRLLGYQPEELANRNVFDYLHPEDLPEIKALFARSLSDPAAVQVRTEVRFRHRNGSWRWFDCTGNNLLHDPHVRGIVVHSRDITEQREAERALRESEAAYRVVVETTRDGLLTVDESGTILFANPAAEALFGYEAPELVGENLTSLMPQRYRDRHSAALSRYAVSGEKSSSGEEMRFPGLHKSGQEIPLEISFGEWAKGGQRLLTGTLRDVRERRQAEEALREREERIRLLLDSTAEAIYGIDTEGGCTFANLACARILGYDDASHLLGKQMHSLMHHTRADGGHYPVAECHINAAISRGEGTHVADEVYWRADGSSFPVEYWSYPMRREGEVVGAVVTFWDISERRALEEQLRQAQKMEAIGNLAGGIAHDFNNMLAVINGYTDLMLKTMPANHPQRGFLSEVSKAGDRAAGLTRQLLAFSRKQILEPRVLDLNAAVLQLDRMLRRLIGEHIELVSLTTPDLGQVQVDASQIEQVLLNLVINARDAMPRGGRIAVQTANVTLDAGISRRITEELPPGEYVQVSVSDTGCGIKPELLERIFEPFFTTKEPGKGTGLGLATAFGIVKQSGGAIFAESQEGVGSTFTVYLPRVALVPTVAAEVHPWQDMPSGTETVLLVEDEAMVRKMVREVLCNCGYTVLEAMQGDEALRLAERHDGPIDLLLTDVVMPRMGGGELARRLQELRPGTPVLFMSGYTDDARMRHGVSEAEIALIQKPFTAPMLAHRIRAALTAARGPNPPGRILVVDDDPAGRETLSDLLQDLGYQVSAAAEGQQALRMLREEPLPAAILLDLQMPGMSGWVFRLEQQKDLRLAEIPVVVMSGVQDAASAGTFLDAAAHLSKPIRVPDLLKVLRRLDPRRPTGEGADE